MASRQDQLHSYQFMVQRVVAAVVMRETDPAQSPFRRVAGASLAGVLLAALSLAAVAVYGVLAPGGGTGWREPGAVIVERESGARYVYLDGRLHPVLNYASALLILGAAQAHTVSVARGAIAAVPRGTPLGIAGAPDSLPEARHLLGMPWTLCSLVPAGAPAGNPGAESVLVVGARRGGGQPLGDAGLLAAAPDGSLSLVWHQRRYPIPDPALVRRAFGWSGESPVPVAAAFANGLDQGPDLAPPAIPGVLGRHSKVGGRRVGTVVVVPTQGGARQYAVVLANGLAPISQVQADLLLSDPAEAGVLGQRRADQMSQADFALAPTVSLPGASGASGAPGGPAAPPAALPASTPRLARPSTVDTGVCARFDDARRAAAVDVDVPLPDAADAVRTGSGPYADRILVAPGRGALVQAVTAPDAPGGTVSLITDLGVRYPVPTAEALAALGYSGTQPVRVPAALVALLPAGRALDPAAARSPASITN